MPKYAHEFDEWGDEEPTPRALNHPFEVDRHVEHSRLRPRYLEQRRHSLQRGYHSDNGPWEQDPWQADSEGGVDDYPRKQHGKVHKPARRGESSEWDDVEDEWETRSRTRRNPPTAPDAPVMGNPALQDYQMQLLLLEEKNKKRLREAREMAEIPASNQQGPRGPPGFPNANPSQIYPDPILDAISGAERDKRSDKEGRRRSRRSRRSRDPEFGLNGFNDLYPGPYREMSQGGSGYIPKADNFGGYDVSYAMERGEHAAHHRRRPRHQHADSDTASLHGQSDGLVEDQPARLPRRSSRPRASFNTAIGEVPLPHLTRRAPTGESLEDLHASSSADDEYYPSLQFHNDRIKSYRKDQFNRPRPARSTSENLHRRPSAFFPSDSRSELGRQPDDDIRDLQTSLTTYNRMTHSGSSRSSVSAVLGKVDDLYKPLENDMDFRLVRVLAERTSRVKCELEIASLEHPPPYLSISYAWGDGMDMTNLRLNGRNKSVPTSLYSALEAVREKDKDILVWIDGLSIDQQNKAERASQVRLMSHIYSRASSMAIWLGPNADNSQLALALLERVAQKKVSKSRITDLDNKDSVALRTLFKRPYWSRLWVVQEVYLSPVKWVYCGSSRIPWQAYEDASNAFWEDEIDPHLRKGPSSFPNMDSLVGLGADRLLEVLCACRKKISENPRDKVFGIMGMLPEETRKELPVNYDQSVKSLFIDVADHIISSTRRLDVIRESIHYPLHVSAADLPTWCPEWSHIPDVSALREWTFSAAGGTDAVYRFYDHERKLEISGIELGTIGATGLPVGTLCAMQNYLMSFLHWHALLLDTANIEADDMHNPTLENFCRTLSLGQVPERWEKGGWAIPCLHAFAVLLMERMPRLPIDRSLQAYARLAVQLGDGYEGDHRSFVQEHFGDRMMGRTFCTTTNGLMGMGSGFMAFGDVVVVAFGCDTPILLRKEGCSDEFRYVGDVYIHGYMHGEALAEGKRPVTKFKLR